MDYKFFDTKLRKGTKKPRICSDIFISKYNNEYRLVVVKNANICVKENIGEQEAKELIETNDLEYVKCDTFSNSGSYRTKKSNALIRELLT